MNMLQYLVAVSLITVSSCLEFSGDEHYNLPELTQLDDYDKCLSMKNALYCFGTFRIHPNGSDSEKYEFIAEYAKLPFHFDRTVLNRGYCVSTRCPPHANPTKRFESCVQASETGLNISLETLHSCRTQEKTVEIDLQILIFLFVLVILLVLNIVGTVNDVRSIGIKNRFWTSWSIKSNWKELVGPFGNNSDTVALAPIQGLRTILIAIVICCHTFGLLAGAYLYNPHYAEEIISSPVSDWLVSLLPVVQVSFALSSFLSAYSLLLTSKKQELNLWMVPRQILKRFFRIAPLHILFIGFNATILPLMGDGPMWSAKIQSEICRKKFWYHLLHINNLILPQDHCLPQTWSLGVDMQLQIVSLILTVLLAKYIRSKLKVLTILLIVSCLLNACVAFIYDIKPTIRNADAETIANLGLNLKYFGPYYYVSPWGSLPSFIVGLIFAHTYFNWRQNDFKVDDRKWVTQLFRFALPMLVLWIASGHLNYLVESPLILAIHLGIERPVVSGLVCIWLFGVIVGGDSSVKDMLSWRGWLPIGRLSLSALMVHWIIILSNLSIRPQPVYASYLTVILDFLGTWCLTYILAIPFTLMVELPVINTYKYFNSKPKTTATSESKKLLDKQE